jgi:CBS domain-containing protein
MRIVPPFDGADDLELIAGSTANVMVTAGSAADRVKWARTIHGRSGSGHRPFIAVCGDAVPIVDGAPHVEGWLGRAVGGTLFIDQIGNLNPQSQRRLLSLLTEQPRDPSLTARPDRRTRIISGSDRSLCADLAVGAFSDALFYRLNVIHIDQLHHNELGDEAMRAWDIMSKPAHTCRPSTDLATVAKIMWDHDCGFVPVVDGAGSVTGVVTDRDICIATSTRGLMPEQLSAAQTMTTQIHACVADDSISDVLATMRRCQVRRVPVVDDHGTVQGVISLNDIVLASNDPRGPQPSAIVATMAAICTHRRVETAVA